MIGKGPPAPLIAFKPIEQIESSRKHSIMHRTHPGRWLRYMMGTHGPCARIVAATFLDRTTLLSVQPVIWSLRRSCVGEKRSNTMLPQPGHAALKLNVKKRVERRNE